MAIHYNQNQSQNPYPEVYKVLQDLYFSPAPPPQILRHSFPWQLEPHFFMSPNSQAWSHQRASVLAVPTVLYMVGTSSLHFNHHLIRSLLCPSNLNSHPVSIPSPCFTSLQSTYYRFIYCLPCPLKCRFHQRFVCLVHCKIQSIYMVNKHSNVC